MPRKKKYFEDIEINDLFHEWLNMRIKMRKPATGHAIDLAIKHLREKSGNGRMKAIEMLNESILKNWLDFYPRESKNTREYTYREMCDLVTKEGYKMNQFERIPNSKFYRKIN